MEKRNEHPRGPRNPEPRFYPTFAMKMAGATSRGFAFDGEIKRLLLERVRVLHPAWSGEQHEMMFFRLLYAGEHFEEFAREKIKRDHWQEDEVEAVRATPMPLSRQDSEPYAAISHPDLDESLKIWPNAVERGTNI